MTRTRIAIHRATIEPWVAVGQSARLLTDILSQVGEPIEGSNFESINDYYPPERSSDWCREFLGAGLEHMVLWADHVAPLRFHEEAVVTHTFRPVQTLSRAAIESAAQAVWVMDGGTARECARRHICLLLDDLDEQRKAATGDERKERLKRSRQIILDRLSPAVEEKDFGQFPGYMNVVKKAAATLAVKGSADADLVDPAVVERLWRASAGSAHGKRWPSLELQVVDPGREISPGQFEAYRAPDPVAITRILNLANSILTYGVLRFADFSGYEPQLGVMMGEAQKRLSDLIPKRTDL
jgi:hypothetical protein